VSTANEPAASRTFIDTREGRFGLVTTPAVPSAVSPDDRANDGANTVLYLHGFPDQPETSVALFEALAARGFTTHAPFLRGYAPSPLRGPFTLEQLTSDVLAIMDALSPDKPVHVFGHDWGAVITYGLSALAPERVASAVTMAVPHPLRFLGALSSPTQLRRSWYMAFFQAPLVPERAIRARDFALVDRLWRAWSPGYELPPALRARLHETFTASGAAPLEYYRAMTRPIGQAIARLRGPLTAKITVPTLHLQGARDGCIGPEACSGAGRYFSADFTEQIVEDAGHFLAHERPELVADRTVAWIRHDFDRASRDQSVRTGIVPD
jgi:pimeloyl-ACP methyl ester carboxylesterase